MKLLLPIVVVMFICVSACTDTKKQSIKEVTISLIEKNYPAKGRRIEYSQIDSTDAELKGYIINRIYIDTDDSIRCEVFHLNYDKTIVKINKDLSCVIAPDLYKLLLVGDSIYSSDLKHDIKRINRVTADYYGIDTNRQVHYKDSIDTLIREADSIAAVAALAAGL